ncbi:hypothetical protein B0H17DRAFT_1269728, partial [Mycena rosella]
MRDSEQPLRGKSRGRIVHVSDFIIESTDSGRLCLTADQILAQMELPVAPTETAADAPANPSGNTPSGPPDIAFEPNPEVPVTSAKKKTKKGKKPKPPKEKNSRKLRATGRTEADHSWVPPPAPNGTKYRLPSFDACRIIYPGANHDPWWDMPQLIAQTRHAIQIFKYIYPDGVAVFIFDCSSAHEAFASDALIAHKMNRGPGGAQPKMHDTINPTTGEPQQMVWPSNTSATDADGKSLTGQAKGMEQALRERQLLSSLDAKNGRYVGVCGNCKKSQAARDKAAKEAKAREDEIEGSGIEGLSERGVSETEAEDLTRSRTCCMQRVLSLQPDFVA